MTNRTGEEQEYTVKIHFVDADGFSVEDSYAGYAFNKISAKSTKRLLNRAMIDTENVPTVTGIRLEVSPLSCLIKYRLYLILSARQLRAAFQRGTVLRNVTRIYGLTPGARPGADKGPELQSVRQVDRATLRIN